MSGADSRVRSPGIFTCARCPVVTSALDAVPEAYHNPATVWWGAFAASAVIRDQVIIVEPVAGPIGKQRRRQDHQPRRSSARTRRAGPSQLGCRVGFAGSDREFPRLTVRSGTQRARSYFREHLIRSKITAVQRWPPLSDRPANTGSDGDQFRVHPRSSMSIVSIRVSKISSGQLRVGLPIARSPRRHFASIWLTVFKSVRRSRLATAVICFFGALG